jgi:2-hydroxy-3-oxopropionate reductase
MIRVGFIGLGLMGVPMCRRILAGGFPLTVWNRTAAKADPLLAEGARWADSPAAVATASDIVITMVTDSRAVEEVACGPNGVLAGAHTGLILIDMSSIEPTTSRAVAARAAAVGVAMLDAPVTGSTPQAETGALGIMVGGAAEQLEIARPVLSQLGSKIIHVGPNGDGITVKLINQIVFACVLEINAEALVLAQKAGVNPQTVMDVLAAGGARTVAMESRGPRIVQRDFAPRFSLANQFKDLTNALGMAHSLGVPILTAALVHQIYQAACVQGKGSLDSAVVVTVLEALAGVIVGGESKS